MKEYSGKIPSTGATFAMVPIPSGKFLMGSPPDEPNRREDEGPQREVEVAPFWMGKFEVTWDLYWPYMLSEIKRNKFGSAESLPDDATFAMLVSAPTNPYLDPTFGMGKEGYPAIMMTHHAACKFCQWLSAQTGHYYRLPTEAEWEYACRAGTKTAYSFGGDVGELSKYGEFWREDGPDAYAKVGTKKPNPWGLFDMHGNVSEWCLDQYYADAYQTGRKTVPPADLYPRVYRGGSWWDDPEDLRSARRFASDDDIMRQDPQLPRSIWHTTDSQHIGFRIVRPLDSSRCRDDGPALEFISQRSRQR
ncbi:MAG: SUMF1/EgtB/PvdO family nonheme iron enzyme [Verrucomicrobiales bacterium]